MSVVEYVAPQNLMAHPKHSYYHSSFLEDDEKYKYVLTDIQINGIRQPVYVQRSTMYILDGHMRVHIALDIGLGTVPVEFFDVDDEEAEIVLISENSKRRGDERSPIKIARQLDFLRKEKGLNQGRKRSEFEAPRLTDEELSALSGLGVRQYQTYVKLMKLSEPLQQMVDAGVIGVRGGSIIASLDLEYQEVFYRAYHEQKRVTEEMCRAFKIQCGRRDRGSQVKRDLEGYVPDPAAVKALMETFDRIEAGQHVPGFIRIDLAQQSSDTTEDASSHTAEATSESGLDRISTVRHSEPVAGNDAVNLGQSLSLIDDHYEQGDVFETLPRNPVDPNRRQAFEGVTEALTRAFEDPAEAESYQAELFVLAVERGIRQLERLEQNIFAVVPTNLTIAKRADLTRLCRAAERLRKKLGALEAQPELM